MVAIMLIGTEPRRRQILWDLDTDQLAVELAMDRRCEGGVSELLKRLVKAEADRKVGILRKTRRPALIGK